MKLSVFTKSLLLVLVTSSSFAQVSQTGLQDRPTETSTFRAPKKSNSAMTLEFSAGYLSSQIDISDAEPFNFKSRDGYTAGTTAILGKNRVKFETGLQFAERGYRASGSFESKDNTIVTTEYLEANVGLKYLEVPLVARLYVLTSRLGSIYVRGGLIGAYLIELNSNGYTRYSDGAIRDQSGTSRKGIEDFDGRGLIGAGTLINFSNKIFGVANVEYQHGLTDIAKESGFSVKNLSTSFTLGLGIRI